MSKTTDVSKKGLMVPRKAYLHLRHRVEKAHTWGDFLHNLALFLDEPVYAIWKATKFDKDSGKPLELTLVKQPQPTPRSWSWRPNAGDQEFKVPECAISEMSKWFTKDNMVKLPVLWHDNGDLERRSNQMLIMSFEQQSTAYNANEAPGSVIVLCFRVLVNKETFYLSSAI